MNTGVVIQSAALSGSDRWRRRRRFLRHAGEMTIAMVAGMVVLGMAFRQLHVALFGTGFDDAWHQHTELAAFAMAFNMTLPMVLLMLYRGHTWERGGEMAAAMFLPALPLLVLLWLGLISAHWVLPIQMVLMLPSMIVAMLYRVAEYSHPHLAKAVATRAP
jgi:flagellar biosynthetic protein FliP